ncbi:RHS domain-containing protein, partial [Pseudomonas corrugata]
NLIRERRGKAQCLVTHYRYDSQHRLIGVTSPDGSETSYRYDAFGRRIEKTVAGQTTEFIWQGDQVIAESSDRHYQSYVYEPGTFRPLALLEGQGPDNATPFHYHNDHLGTPQELTSHQGEIVWAARYNGYGKLTELRHGDGKRLEQPLRFQGQYHDRESGLHYNRHRYYNPETGRYLTLDPSKLKGGLNGYRYTLNPTGWVDPLGLVDCPGNKNKPIEREQKSEPPPPQPSRHGAFRHAKSDAGIPKSQQPDPVYDATTGKTQQYSYARMTDKSGERILTTEGTPILTREYQFTRPDGSKIIIQDHSAGHQYHQPQNRGDQEAHFNLRPIENRRTGKVHNAKDHYYFKE